MKRGILITILVLVIILVVLFAIAGFIYLQFTQEPSVPNEAFLKLTLRGNVLESVASSWPFQATPLTVRELWYQLERARVDERIQGLILKISYLDTGYAKVNEIGGLLRDFSAGNKPVYAFIEEGGLKEYLLASFADRVYAFKSGFFTIRGLSAEAVFLKNTLAKLGIEAELFHMGDYKSAVEIFTGTGMSPAHREALEKILLDIHGSIVSTVAVNRNLDEEAVRDIIDASPVSVEEYLAAGFFDELGYEDSVLEALEITPAKVIDFATYAKTTAPLPFSGRNKIAVVFAGGEINTGKSGGQGLFGDRIIGSDTLADQLRSLRRNRSVKAVVLRVDSPGGSAVASEIIRREAELLLAEKPVVISMSDVAASGGYWISLAASRIIAQPQTITGSIGVIMGKFVLKGFYDKIGISKEIVQTTDTAAMFSDYRFFSEDEKKKVLFMMRRFYDEFITRVAQWRGQDPAFIEKVAQGRIWSGLAALEHKLIDGLGGLPKAVAIARDLAGIPPEEEIGIIFSPRKRGFLESLLELGEVRSGFSVREMEAALDRLQKSFPASMMPFRISFVR